MDFIEAAQSILDEIAGFNLDKMWIEAVEATTPLILELLTKRQLGNEGEGIDGDGNPLGEYTQFTINVRQELGLQTDHVSFEFTGEFLNGMDVEPTLTGWRITKDEERHEKLTVELGFSDKYIELTIENEEIVSEEIRKVYTDAIS